MEVRWFETKPVTFSITEYKRGLEDVWIGKLPKGDGICVFSTKEAGEQFALVTPVELVPAINTPEGLREVNESMYILFQNNTRAVVPKEAFDATLLTGKYKLKNNCPGSCDTCVTAKTE